MESDQKLEVKQRASVGYGAREQRWLPKGWRAAEPAATAEAAIGGAASAASRGAVIISLESNKEVWPKENKETNG